MINEGVAFFSTLSGTVQKGNPTHSQFIFRKVQSGICTLKAAIYNSYTHKRVHITSPESDIYTRRHLQCHGKQM